jgi:hypothetical protein
MGKRHSWPELKKETSTDTAEYWYCPKCHIVIIAIASDNFV